METRTCRSCGAVGCAATCGFMDFAAMADALQFADRVKTTSMGYKDMVWIVLEPAPKDKHDGMDRYYLRRIGKLDERIAFRRDEIVFIEHKPTGSTVPNA